MSKTPSEKTQLATAKRQGNEMKREISDLINRCRQLNARNIFLEEELKEWKRRFDELLRLRNENQRPS